ncbi:uncharacterized protein ACR2FA_006877 [Aphomia sociella]
MNSSDCDKTHKYKRPKQKTTSTTKPQTSTSNDTTSRHESKRSEPLCSLLAKDSEWVDILQAPMTEANKSSNVCNEEELLQLVECEDSPQTKPLAVMFPGLLERDPQTLEGMLTKAMSTTEVTKHLVDLGQKANFTFMKKTNRLIPPDKQWLESLTENSNSYSSLISGYFSESISSDYEADDEIADSTEPKQNILAIETTNDTVLVNNTSQDTYAEGRCYSFRTLQTIRGACFEDLFGIIPVAKSHHRTT